VARRRAVPPLNASLPHRDAAKAWRGTSQERSRAQWTARGCGDHQSLRAACSK
jgi:hypothetical protein